MSSFLSHIVHGVENGLVTLATTGNPALAAGAGVLGAVSDSGAGASPAQPPLLASPLLTALQAENPAERTNVNALSSFASGAQQNDFADLIGGAA